MALFAQSLSSMAQGYLFGNPIAGPKGAPPTIPPIIINPDDPRSEHEPGLAIDPRVIPVGPPLVPPPRPAIWLAY